MLESSVRAAAHSVRNKLERRVLPEAMKAVVYSPRKRKREWCLLKTSYLDEWGFLFLWHIGIEFLRVTNCSLCMMWFQYFLLALQLLERIELVVR